MGEIVEGRTGGWIEVSGEDILGKKMVDKSLFYGKTTVPYSLIKDFLKVLKKQDLEKGQGVSISVLIDNKESTAIFRHVDVKGRDNIYNIGLKKEVTEYLKEKLYRSYKYIFELNENPNLERPQEYIEFYKTDKPNTFMVKLIVDNNYIFKELPNEKLSNSKDVEKDNLENKFKEKFFSYVGDKEEKLGNKYQKSYKLVLLTALLELADFEGKAVFDDVCSYIMNNYIERHKKGLLVETSDSEIQKSIENLSLNIVKRVMSGKPYEAISRENYISKESVDDVEYLSFNKELWDELTDEDKEELIDILKYKLERYYLEKNLGENVMSKQYYLYNINPRNPKVWKCCLENKCAVISYIDNLDRTNVISQTLKTANEIKIGSKILAYAPPKQIVAVGDVIREYYVEEDKDKFVYNGVDIDKEDSTRSFNQRIGVNWTNILSYPLYIEDFDAKIEQKSNVAKSVKAFSELTEKGFKNAEEIIKNILLGSSLDFSVGIEEMAAVNEETDILKTAISKKISSLEKDFDIKTVIEFIHNYIVAKGYEYSIDIIKNLYLCLKTKPFVILYGISGTGKSKLIELFAEAIGASKEDGTYNLIPVRPDWSDASELIGYRNIDGKFQPGILINIIRNAMNHKEVPYFVCLDEMNLARVEYYFSDILSIMETRDKKALEVITDKLTRRELFGGDSEAIEAYGDLYIPENLYIVGTVNMDETTFPFSKKVLDRANTIEFNEINMDYDFDRKQVEINPKIYSNKLLLSEYIKISECKENKETAKEIIEELKEINSALEECDMQFAYRVRDEAVFYVIYAVSEGIMDLYEALDYAIKQKILPRISGSSSEVEQCLFKLFISFSNINTSNLSTDYVEEETLKKINDYIKDDKKKLKDGSRKESVCKYPISSEKILKMLWRFNKDGFTTFW